MLCVPWLKALVAHAAVRALPLPVGLVPVTVAVKVTSVPTVDGFNELANVVVDGGGPAAAEPQASTSTRREYCISALVTLTRMRVVVKGAKVAARLTRLLPLMVASVVQALPVQPCTLKSVTPYWAKVRL